MKSIFNIAGEKVKANYPNFSNPRNAVAGTLNAKNTHIDLANLIDFVAYEVLDRPGLTPVEQHKLLKSYKFKTTIPIHLIVTKEYLNSN
jgi:NAD-dependent DNA ligase